jgi:hypothetical protein
MVNFRVRDLERIAVQLRAAGIAIKIDPRLISTVGSLAYVTVREIRSHCGNLQGRDAAR